MASNPLKKIPSSAIAWAILLLLPFFGAKADTVYLKSGDILTGKITNQTEKFIEIQDPDRGTVTVQKTNIRRISYQKSDDQAELQRRQKAAEAEQLRLRQAEEARIREEQDRLAAEEAERLRKEQEERKRLAEEKLKEEQRKKEEAEKYIQEIKTPVSGHDNVWGLCSHFLTGFSPIGCSFHHAARNGWAGHSFGFAKTLGFIALIDLYFSRQFSRSDYAIDMISVYNKGMSQDLTSIALFSRVRKYGYVGISGIYWVPLTRVNRFNTESDYERKNQARDEKFNRLRTIGYSILGLMLIDGATSLIFQSGGSSRVSDNGLYNGLNFAVLPVADNESEISFSYTFFF